MKRPFNELLSEYLDGTLPDSELQDFFSQVADNRPLLENVIDEQAATGQLLPGHKQRTERMLLRMESILDKAEEPAVLKAVSSRITTLRRWSWAAAAVLLVATGAYLWTTSHKKNTSAAITAKTMTIAPGHNGAILTLSNGVQVMLDNLQNGVVAQQTGAQVLLQNGQLKYDALKEKTGEVAYNTMTTPRGRQFQLTLPDGTKVWLNAASSIRYPTVFAGAERKVEMTGEAYFEVAKNTKMPFRVLVNNREEIEVLGTHFNVNAYENERTLNTTLLEGSVRLAVRSQPQTILKPGQQAQLRDEMTIVNTANLDKVMAWKNGAFDFEDLSLVEVMRQLERWYDIKVVYEQGVPDVRFGGKIGRDVSLADLLVILGGTKLKFRMQDRELVIMQ